MRGDINVGGYTALPITFKAMVTNDQQLMFLTTMIEDQEHRVSYELRPKTPEGMEPAIESIKELKGKRIGILPTTAYQEWLKEILKAHKVDPAEVVIRLLLPAVQAEALNIGAVDALFTHDPWATAAIADDIAELISDEVMVPQAMDMDSFPFGSFNISKEWADANSDLVERIGAALDEAVIFVNDNPAEAKNAMRSYLPDSVRAYVEEYPDAYYLTTRASDESIFQTMADKYHMLGVIPEALDLTDLVLER